MKTTKNITTETINIDQTKMNNPPQQNLKKGNAASATNRGQEGLNQNNKLVKETIKTLSN